MLAAIVAIVRSGESDRGVSIATTVGTALTLCYFAQKQKLEELSLFKDLFTDFNHRYDEMNEKLENIRSGNQLVDSNGRNTLVDYFNLRAEDSEENKPFPHYLE